MSNIRSFTLATLLSLGTATTSVAQDWTDALRYSYLSESGTARSMGIGGAQGSIGGDFSGLSVNPAGIAIYKSSDIMFTPSMKLNTVTSTYLNNNTTTNNSQFNFNNAGVVFTKVLKGRRAQRSKWKSVSYGFGVNRLADFNRNYTYGANNYTTSQTQAMAADAQYNGNAQVPGTLGYFGYQSYLTNVTDSATNTYQSIVDPTKGLAQLKSVTESGGINEVVFSLGGNYMDQLLLGATIGIPVINYSRTATYSETAIGTDTSGFNSYTYTENLNTTGSGINFKFGLIYKPSEYFRFGAAFHSPTWYNLHEDDGVNITTNVSGSTTPYYYPNSFDYSLVTPWRGILSATAFLGSHGFITADYEYVDYTAASFSFDPNSPNIAQETNSNQQIKSILQPASNVRVGVEVRITSFFSLRGGYSYMGSPYSNSSGINAASNTISGGIGFRFDHWYLDAALAHTMYNGIEQPYPAYPTATSTSTNPAYVVVPTATIGNSLNNASMTVGFRF